MAALPIHNVAAAHVAAVRQPTALVAPAKLGSSLRGHWAHSSHGRCSLALSAAASPIKAGRVAPRAAAAAAEPEVTIDNCTVLVVGEEGAGMEVVRRFARAGSWVTAYQTAEQHRKEIEGLGAFLALGEATSADKIAKTLRSNTFDAIVFSVSSDSPDSMASLNAQLNVIIQAREAKIPKFLLVSSAGAEDEETLASVEANLREGEAGMKWTIVRTGPLVPESSAKPTLTEDSSAPRGSVTSSDLAFLVTQVLFDADFENKVLSAVSLEQ